MLGKRTQDLPALPAEENLFRPWRSESSYNVLLVTLATAFSVVAYSETHPVLESQIALGFDPAEVVKCVLVALAGVMSLLTFAALRARRLLLTTGELRFMGSTLIVSTGSSPVGREMSELQQIRCSPSGASVRMRFRDGAVRLSGQWLPPGWRRTRKGWLTPSTALITLSRETHPLLGALRDRRPDLTPKTSGLRLAGIVAAELLMGVLFFFVANFGSYPLYAEARRAAGRPRVDDAAMKAFQEGRYLEACEDFRRAFPDLRRDLYGSQSAAEFLLYCGDRKGALKAALGYDLQPFWPVAMDPEPLARIRISTGRHAEAASLLQGRPGYLLYEALAEQGRRGEAEQVLKTLAPKKGMAQVLLLRIQGRGTEAREAAAILLAALSRHKAGTPSGLARVFELELVEKGLRGLQEDPRFEPASRALPELRRELIRFSKRETPELEGLLRSDLDKQGDRRPAGS